MAKRGVKVRHGSGGISWHGARPPAGLSDAAAEEWHEMVALLRSVGCLDRTAPKLVELYAVNSAMLAQARARIDAEGVTTRSSTGTVHVHPAVAIVNQATIRLRGLIADLGLAPASTRHAGLPASAGGEDRADPWNGLIAVG
jgi:P27 family predicted phage terminase small subunit